MTDPEDHLARLERVVERHWQLERESARNCEEQRRLFDPRTNPPDKQSRSRKILAALEPRIREDVARLEPRFRDVVRSPEWRRLLDATRALEGTPRALLPWLRVSLTDKRAYFLHEPAPDAILQEGVFCWSVRAGELSLRWMLQSSFSSATSAELATFSRFSELATLAVQGAKGRAAERLEFATTSGRSVWLGVSEARATLALATARLLETVEGGKLISLAARFVGEGWEGCGR